MLTARIGFRAAIAALTATLAYGVVQIAQVAGLVGPPLDATLIYAASLCIAPPFLLAILALRHSAAASGRLWGEAAVMAAGAYLAFALLVYGVQLGTVIPYGAGLPGAAVLVMRPHALFWTIDALAYVCMGGSALLAGLSLARSAQPQLLRAALLAHGAVTPLIAWAYFSPRFGLATLLVGSPWLVTAIAALGLLACHFRLEAAARSASPRRTVHSARHRSP